MQFFNFKHFKITDDRSAMKVGTDSVILGSWVNIDNRISVLDIGGGSGLISLMIAQRSSISTITSIEIEEGSYQDALFNFRNSPWAPQLIAIHSDVRNIDRNHKYDLIISNPPFFNAAVLPPNNTRATARHDSQLSLMELIDVVENSLSDSGLFAIVFPYEREGDLLEVAKNKGLFPNRILRTMNKPDATIKRSFIQFGRNPSKLVEQELLSIRNIENSYSEDYKGLTKDFYLNF